MASATGPRPRTHAHLLQAGAAAVLGHGGRVVALRRERLHLGEGSAEPVGRPVDALAPPMLGHTLHRLWEQVMESGEACSAEVGFAAPDHPARALSLRVAPAPHTAGMAVVTARDATHGRRVFQELASEVQRVRAEARTWEEAAHAVAHDVRSPLASLRGFLALLQRGADRWPAVEASHLHRAAAIADAIQAVVETHLQPASDPELPAPPAATCDLAECATQVLHELRAAHPGVELSWVARGAQELLGLFQQVWQRALVSLVAAQAIGGDRPCVEVLPQHGPGRLGNQPGRRPPNRRGVGLAREHRGCRPTPARDGAVSCSSPAESSPARGRSPDRGATLPARGGPPTMESQEVPNAQHHPVDRR
ncbi:MAG: PAS domain-containing protein [Deferrisomatales bacterium]